MIFYVSASTFYNACLPPLWSNKVSSPGATPLFKHSSCNKASFCEKSGAYSINSYMVFCVSCWSASTGIYSNLKIKSSLPWSCSTLLRPS